MTKFKAAVVQMGPVPFDKAATVEKVISFIHEAAAQGVELIVFPEATIAGYPKGADFGARVGGRLPRGREEFLRYFNGAISVPGPEIEQLCDAASEAGAYIVIGVMEKELGTQYCTSVHISPTEGLMGKHRKLMPTAMERLAWGSADGSTMPVHDTSIGKLGTGICWENDSPLVRSMRYRRD